MERRTFLRTLAVAGSALGAGWLLRPRDRGAGGHDASFARLGRSLRAHGLARPTMLLDLDALDANIGAVVEAAAPRAFRIVAKSLPSLPLLEHVMKAAATDRLMLFHEPFLSAAAESCPGADLLVGKPLPAAAADHFHRRPARGPFDPTRQLQWLIDTPERLRQYRELAAAHAIPLQVNIEIDVGLHRGGVDSPAGLTRMLDAIAADPNLRFAGLMGYDPHVVAMPDLLGARAREFGRVQARYRAMVDAVRAHPADFAEDRLVFNTAGSPTYRLWSRVEGIANEIAVGSGLVKPTDFDLTTLASHRPALYIATPVLKATHGTAVPGLALVGDGQRAWNPNRARTFFIYGGKWMARPVSPPGLVLNPLWGRSSNQEMLNGSNRVDLEVDDYVFFRPTQSESVMLQFGDIAVVRSGEIVDFWSPFPRVS